MLPHHHFRFIHHPQIPQLTMLNSKNPLPRGIIRHRPRCTHNLESCSRKTYILGEESPLESNNLPWRLFLHLSRPTLFSSSRKPIMSRVARTINVASTLFFPPWFCCSGFDSVSKQAVRTFANRV